MSSPNPRDRPFAKKKVAKKMGQSRDWGAEKARNAAQMARYDALRSKHDATQNALLKVNNAKELARRKEIYARYEANKK